ncbi:hypothetical protein ACN47E_009966 [Coniothyrium glycines]
MYTSTLLTNFLFLLSTFTLISASDLLGAKLEVRQASTTPSQAELCLDYQITANMSTVGANSSYRTVVMQKAPVGTIYSARMMDAAIKKLPTLTADRTLNMVCGNWTEIAVKEAAVNFTQGIVAQYTTANLPVGIKAGPEVVIIVGAISILMSVVWVFSG